MRSLRLLFLPILIFGLASPAFAAQEQTYLPGQSVRVRAQRSLRSEPRYAGEVLATLTPDDTVTIIDGIPVSGDALSWYQVSLDGTSLIGWIPDIALDPSAALLVQSLPITQYEDTPTSRNPPRACTGLIAYETDYFTAMMLSTYDYPEASDILTQLALIGTVGGKTLFELDSEQYTALGGFYTAFAEQLRLIQPPAFAEVPHVALELDTHAPLRSTSFVGHRGWMAAQGRVARRPRAGSIVAERALDARTCPDDAADDHRQHDDEASDDGELPVARTKPERDRGDDGHPDDERQGPQVLAKHRLHDTTHPS